jgi:SSS family solute:Na+ symporter
VRQVKPAGPGWAGVRRRTGVEPEETLLDLLSQLVFSCAVLFGALLGIGGFLLKLPLWGWGGLVVAVLGVVGLQRRAALQGGLRRLLAQAPQG